MNGFEKTGLGYYINPKTLTSDELNLISQQTKKYNAELWDNLNTYWFGNNQEYKVFVTKKGMEIDLQDMKLFKSVSGKIYLLSVT